MEASYTTDPSVSTPGYVGGFVLCADADCTEIIAFSTDGVFIHDGTLGVDYAPVEYYISTAVVLAADISNTDADCFKLGETAASTVEFLEPEGDVCVAAAGNVSVGDLFGHCGAESISFEVSDYNANSNFTQTYFLTRADGTILEIANGNEFDALNIVGQYCIYWINYANDAPVTMPFPGTNIADFVPDDNACFDYDPSSCANFNVVLPLTIAYEEIYSCNVSSPSFNVALKVLGGAATLDSDITYSLEGSIAPEGFVATPGVTYTFGPFDLVSSADWNVNLTDAELGCDQALASVAQCTVPVTWLEFDGEVLADGNELSWGTATETDNIGFHIERSWDGINFERIGFVQGVGNSQTVQNYTYLDTNAPMGLLYYRLAQVDNDGKLDYSEVINLQRGATTELAFINIAPVPIADQLSIYYQAIPDQPVDVAIYNTLGQLIKQQRVVNSSSELNQLTIDMSNVAAGVYFIQISQFGQQQTTKAVKE